jgi:hypothetical protein
MFSKKWFCETFTFQFAGSVPSPLERAEGEALEE